jgi:predicted dehydrogenase
MAANLEEAEMMLAVGNEFSRLVKQIVPSPFTLKVDATVCRLIESGELGAIKEVLVEHSHGGLCNPESPLSWRQDRKYSGINMLTMGIYHEVVYRWLRKDLNWLTAHGTILTKHRRHWETGQKENVMLPDSLCIQGQFIDDIAFQYRFSGVDHGVGKNEIRLIGEKGILRLDVGRGILFLGKNGKEELVQIDAETAIGWKVEEDFIKSIRHGTPVTLTSFEDGVAYMRFTKAVWNSITH